MRVLQLCSKSPWPPVEGGSIAMKAMTDSMLRQGHVVKVLAMSTSKCPVKTEDIPDNFREQTRFSTGRVDLTVRPIKAFFNLFNRNSYIVKRFESDDFRNALRNTLLARQFDIIILETLYLTPYMEDIREMSNAAVVLRAHNVEHKIWERYAANSHVPLKRWYLKKLSKELERYEKSHINDYDGILPITSVDKEFYENQGARGLIMAHPFALDTENHQQKIKNRDNNCLFHLGSMDWLPNQEGISWFLDKVWQNVKKQHPGLNFCLAGRNIPLWMMRRQEPGLVIDGEVPDAHDYMQSKNIMVVPLFSGSGIRIKIVEGMLNKNAIITTAIGAEGIDCEPGKHLLIANNEAEFEEKINWCMDNPEETRLIGEAASQLVKEKYNIQESSLRLTEYFQQLNNRNNN